MTTSIVSELFQELDRGGLAITSTRRLSRQVEQRYAEWKMEAGAGAWPTPRVRVWEDWLHGIWQTGFEHHPGAPRLLTEDQELLLWEQVIRRRAPAGGDRVPLQLSGTARAARNSWNRTHDWQIDWHRMGERRGADTEAFVDWAGEVRRTLADRNWLTPAQLPQYLVNHAADWLPGREGPVWWMGFDAMTPATRMVIELLADHGLAQKHFGDAGIDCPGATVVACGDAEDEWQRIARWARDALTEEPQVRLGVVCPDLHSRRDAIEEILEDVLHPELAWRVDAPRVFHLSLGRPLTEYPLVGSALDLLRWSGARIPFEVVSRTLRSPYVGACNDLDARVDFEIALRRTGQETFTLDYLARLAGERPGLEAFARHLEVARSLDTPEQENPDGWSAYFSVWLRAFNWPGERSLNSQEHQTANAWREQLSRFAGLNTVRERWTLSEAVGKLSAMTAERILQFHDDQAPLQILGAGECAGLWFDRIWLADMSDTVWPPPPRPDPFIPVSLQKESGMPNASAQAVLAHTRTRTAGLMSSARCITVSFAADDGGTHEVLSPLFSACPEGEPGDTGGYPGRTKQLMRAGPGLETVADHHAPPPRDRALRGGVAVLADQARCPFRALAHHRLHARDLEQVVPGLDPATRGRLVHEVLKQAWDRLGDSDALNGLDDAGLEALVAEVSARALAGEFADSLFQRGFLDIERTRLAGLLREWLAVETQRPWFRVVGTETAMRLELGGAWFDVRADRIDELADGRRVIIDYKTGRLPAVGDWAEPRMDEPQLPMYALSIDEDIAALALAGIRRGECELRGVADNVEDMGSVKPVAELGFQSMAQIRSWWESALGSLVDAYRNGDARVDPRSTRTCRHCDAAPLCRVFERGDPVA
ncbi:MAG: PD-(D/E)XK nuclease family protein [Gammaproteobacteria bacterium]|nr:PD-(D/E)XK nuclease family protein [Gammaproteobacteria bacterium]